MLIVRYISAFIISCLLTIIVFFLMQKMLSFEQQVFHHEQNLPGLDFVRLIRKPETAPKIYKTRSPEIPKPPEKKIPLAKRQALKISKPKLEPIVLTAPRLRATFNVNDALYLGEYHNKTIEQQPLQSDAEVVPLVRIAPLYPLRAAKIGIEGWVKMEVFINSQGHVETVKVLEAQPSNIFNRAAAKAMKHWRFRPKIVAGKAVSRIAEQTINFRLHK